MSHNKITWDSIRAEVIADPQVKAEYDALESEFDLARRVIALRKASGLNQRDFTARVGIKQPQLARLESGKQMPKLDTLSKIASGAGYEIEIHFVPKQNRQIKEVEPLRISIIDSVTES
jgi:transcriptional regulator with XRE-family HTH domain